MAERKLDKHMQTMPSEKYGESAWSVEPLLKINPNEKNMVKILKMVEMVKMTTNPYLTYPPTQQCRVYAAQG